MHEGKTSDCCFITTDCQFTWIFNQLGNLDHQLTWFVNSFAMKIENGPRMKNLWILKWTKYEDSLVQKFLKTFKDRNFFKVLQRIEDFHYCSIQSTLTISQLGSSIKVLIVFDSFLEHNVSIIVLLLFVRFENFQTFVLFLLKTSQNHSRQLRMIKSLFVYLRS